MIQIRNFAPPYSQVVIRDPTAMVNVPDWENGVPVVATETCILCACQPDMDGETEFVLGTNRQVNMEGLTVFEGTLGTPGRKIALKTVEGDVILEMPTSGLRTFVRIWTNRLRSPDKVCIGID